MGKKKDQSSVPKKKKWIWLWVLLALAVIGLMMPKSNTPKSEVHESTADSQQTSDSLKTQAEEQEISETISSEALSDTNTEKESVDEAAYIEKVKDAIKDSISLDNETITDVTLANGDLCVHVDISKHDPAPLTTDDLVWSRTGSVTDAILDLDEKYDELWETITVDFGPAGKIINQKDQVELNDFGMRCFDPANFEILH